MCKFICKLIPYCDTSDETDTLSLETSRSGYAKKVQNQRDQPTDRRTATLSPPIKADNFSQLASVLKNSRREKEEGGYYYCSLLWPVFWWLKFQVDKTAIKFIISKYLIIPFSQLTKTGLSWRTPMTRSWIGTRKWRSTIAWRSLPSPKDAWGFMPTTAWDRVSEPGHTSSPVTEDVNMGRVGPGPRIVQSRLFLTTEMILNILTSIGSRSTTGSDALPRRKEIPTVSTVSWRLDRMVAADMLIRWF